MDISTVVKTLNDATTDPTSITEADKAQLLETCTNVVSTFQSVEKKLMDLLFAVSMSVEVYTASNLCASANEGNRSSSRH
jgi:hypothetical protein